MNDSPYAPPASSVADPVESRSAAELTRQEHIRHEMQLKSVGSLFYLSSLFLISSGAAFLLTLDSRQDLTALITGALLSGLGIGSVVFGYGLRRLRPWSHVPSGLLSGIGLLGFPFGTLINGWILYLLFCQKGRTIFAPNYQEIVDATPHIKYRRSVGDWIATGILALIVVGVVALVLAASYSR